MIEENQKAKAAVPRAKNEPTQKQLRYAEYLTKEMKREGIPIRRKKPITKADYIGYINSCKQKLDNLKKPIREKKIDDQPKKKKNNNQYEERRECGRCGMLNLTTMRCPNKKNQTPGKRDKACGLFRDYKNLKESKWANKAFRED